MAGQGYPAGEDKEQDRRLQAWLDAAEPEPTLEPTRAIIDCHHHLLIEEGGTPSKYLLAEFAADVHSGHNVVQTVYAECKSMYDPVDAAAPGMEVVGETTFAAGLAHMSASRPAGCTAAAGWQRRSSARWTSPWARAPSTRCSGPTWR